MKNIIKISLLLIILPAASYLSACPSGFSHRADNKCYKGYIPSCPGMAKGAKKTIVTDGQDYCQINGTRSAQPSCTQGGTYKNDYMKGVTGLPPHMSTAEDYCIKEEKTISCPNMARPVVGPKGHITDCLMNKIEYFKCPTGLTFAALKGNDVSGFACRSNSTVKAANCPNGLKMGMSEGKPYCSGDVKVKPTYK